MGEGKGFAHLYLPKEIWKPRGLGERAAGALPPPPAILRSLVGLPM